MDLYYIEEGYYDAGYFVYTANAESAIASTASVSVTAGVIKSAGAAIQSNFSQSALGQRTSDIDLFAFSDAALTVSALVIRDNNITASSVFNVAIDFVRTRSVSSDDNAAFAINVINQRSRAFTIETQAAFSLTANATVFIGTIQALTSTSSLSATGSVPIKGGRANLVATSTVFTSPKFGSMRPFNMSSNGDKIDATRSKAGTNSAKLAINNSITSCDSTGALAGRNEFAIHAGQDFVFEMWLWKDNLTLATSSGEIIAGFGTQSGASTSTLTTLSGFNDNTQGWAIGVANANQYLEAKFTAITDPGASGGTVRTITSTTTLSSNNWSHVALRRRDGNTVELLLNNSVIGTYASESSAIFADGAVALNERRLYVANNFSNFGGSNNAAIWIDEVSYRIGSSSIAGYTTQPIQNDPATQQVLMHFDYSNIGSSGRYVYSDDTGILVEVSAELSSRATVAFNGGLRIVGAAALASQAAITASAEIAILFDIALSSQASLTASIDLVKNVTANISSQFSQSTAGNIVKQLSSDISSAAAVNAIVSRTRDCNSSIQSEFTQTTNLTATRLGSANLESSSNISTINATKTVDAVIYTEAIASELATVAKVGNTLVTVQIVSTVSASSNKTASGAAQLSSVAAVSAVGNVIVNGATVLTSSTQVSLSAIRFRGIESAISSSTTLSTTADVVFNASMTAQTSFFTVGAAVKRLRGVDTALVGQLTVAATAISQRIGNAQLSSQFAQSTSVNISATLSSVLSTASALNCTISHIEGADLVAFTNASLSVTAETGLFGDAAFASQSALNIQFTKIEQGQAALSAVADIANDFRLTRGFASQISVVSTTVAIVNRVVNPGSTMSVAATLAGAISHIEGADLVAFTNAALTTSARRLRGVTVNAVSTASVSATGLRRKGFTVAIQSNSTMTVTATTLILLDAAITSRVTVSATVSIRKTLSATISSAMTFVAAVREINADSINQNVWTITRENWEYTISNEDRNYLIRR